ncbi:AraC family transcriptional regulator [Paucibacter sp. Y2R2-4]|uniref:AraC family transcriptional regulator n=1 Tax=Paucibacter sp. Y2R2-4 TaxID=2893553 RepID=UPI0021E4291A|nr:AraC family transcriptional regulator [Paucibacter sp. Y2R2-4]MCV2349096.1 AraC family transcriptional regulator [Paucibacter sp. Y2R2-4]
MTASAELGATQPLGTAQVHPTYARLLCMLLRSLGADVEGSLASAGLSWDELSVRDQMLDFAVVHQLVLAALAASERPALGLDLGQMAQISAHGAMGYAMVASRDLRQALETVARFASLRNGLLRFELQQGEAGAVLLVHECCDLGHARGFVLDMVLGTALRLMESVVGHRVQGMRIDWPFAQAPDPSWLARLRQCFEGPIAFDAPLLAFHLSLVQLSLPCLTADPRAFEAARQDCERELAQARGGQGPWALRVQQLLLQRSPGEPFPGVAEAAAHCHVSVRTLIRHLRAEACSYQSVLDGVRQEQTLRALRQGKSSVEVIAAELGFVDTSNFSRTVRRWFGLTPSALRARLRGDIAAQ